MCACWKTKRFEILYNEMPVTGENRRMHLMMRFAKGYVLTDLIARKAPKNANHNIMFKRII